jgi:hypothetical protein
VSRRFNRLVEQFLLRRRKLRVGLGRSWSIRGLGLGNFRRLVLGRKEQGPIDPPDGMSPVVLARFCGADPTLKLNLVFVREVLPVPIGRRDDALPVDLNVGQVEIESLLAFRFLSAQSETGLLIS